MSILDKAKNAVFGGPKPADPPKPQTPSSDSDLGLIQTYRNEAQEFRSGGLGSVQGDQGLESEWWQGANQYLGNHYATTGAAAGTTEAYRYYLNSDGDTGDAEGMIRAVLNRDQPAVIANVEAQTSRPIPIRLEPVETNEPARSYLTEKAGRRLYGLYQQALGLIEAERDANLAAAGGDEAAIGAAAEVMNEQVAMMREQFIIPGLSPDQMVGAYGPTQPLADDQVGKVKELVAAGVMDRDDLFVANDAARTQLIQRLFDIRWRQARGPAALKRALLYSNIYGQQLIRGQWHDAGPLAHRFSLHTDHIRNIWIDHVAQSFHEVRYLLLDQLMTRRQLQDLYPDLTEDELDRAERSGMDAGDGFARGGTYGRAGGLQSQEGLILVSTAWLRHQEVPLSPRQALDAGLVTREPVMSEMPEGVEGEAEQERDEKTGRLRWRYFAGEQEVEPQEECDHGTAWPNGSGIKQVVAIPGASIKLQSIRCPYREIPGGWTINVPRPDYSIYGQGECVRLKHLSDAINREFSIMLNHDRFYQSPMIYMPDDLYDELERSGIDPNIRPGVVQPVEKGLWQEMVAAGGFNSMIANPPAMPQGTVDKIRFLLEQHDAVSGHQASRQGRAPYSGAPASLVTELNEQALGPVAYKASHLEDAVQDLAEVLVDAIVRFTPEREWQKVATGMPLAAMRDLLAGAEMAALNFTVEVSAGRGANRDADEQRALALYGQQLISRRTTQEKVRVEDPDAENRRIQEEQGMVAATAAAPAPVAPQPQVAAPAA